MAPARSPATFSVTRGPVPLVLARGILRADLTKGEDGCVWPTIPAVQSTKNDSRLSISQVSVRKLMFSSRNPSVYTRWNPNYTPLFSLLSAIDLHLLKVGKSLRSQNVSPPNSLMLHYLSPLNLVGFFFVSKPLIAAERKMWNRPSVSWRFFSADLGFG